MLWVVDAIQTFIGIIKIFFDSLDNSSIEDFADNIFSLIDLYDLGDTALNRFVTALRVFLAKLMETGDPIEAIKKSFFSLRDAVTNLGESLGELVGNALKNLADWFDSIDWRAVGESVVNGIANAIGAAIGGILAIATALVQFWPDWVQILIIAAIFAGGQFLEGNFLSPKLVGRSIGVHPVWLMFALLAFGYLFGIAGILLAVPLAAAIGVLSRVLLDQYLSSRLYLGSSVRRPKPPTD